MQSPMRRKLTMNARMIHLLLGLVLTLIQAPTSTAVAAPAGFVSTVSSRHTLQRDLDNARARQAQFPGKISELDMGEARQALNAAGTPASDNQAQPNGAPVIRSEAESNDIPFFANEIDLRLHYAQVNAAIGTPGDVDYFYFRADAGARVWILADTGGTQNPGANSRDTIVDLLAADGTTLIESDDDDGSGTGGDATVESGNASAIAGRLLTESGIYYVKVRCYDASKTVSPYQLFIALSSDEQVSEIEPNNSGLSANPIQAPIGTRSGEISSGTDIDYFSFRANAGDIAFIALDADPERDNTGFDAVLELRDSSLGSSLIATIDSSFSGSIGDPPAEAFRFNVVSGGKYVVAVKGIDSSALGNYRLMVAVSPTAAVQPEIESNNSPASADSLNAVGNYAEGHGSIPAGDFDFWTFTLTTASFVWISTDVPLIGLSSADTKIDLLAGDGITVIESDDDDGACNDRGGTVYSGNCSQISGTFLSAGTYYILVRGFQSSTVIKQYRLYLAQTPFSATSEAESNDTIALADFLTDTIGMRYGDISPAGDVDYYRIEAKGGDVVYFMADGSFFGPNTNLVLELRDASGSVLLSVDSSAEAIATRVGEGAQYAIPLNERTVYSYYVVVRHFNSSGTGSYKLMGYVYPGGDRIHRSGFE
jgi:Bacterial pre-peptidase C-terminal domain